MQTTKLLLLGTIIVAGIAACSKSDHSVSPASLTIVHAMPQGKTIIPVFSNSPITFFNGASTIAYGAAGYYSPSGGYTPLQVVKSTDTLHPVFNGGFDFSSGNAYSLFISGDTTKPDTMFVKDAIPTFGDSSSAVRFVNLSPASAPISINIKANGAAKKEFTGIGYRQISDFKTFAANSAAGTSYIFEVRNQPNDSLLVTYTWTYIRQRSHTLVLAGIVNATTGKPASLKVFPIKNF